MDSALVDGALDDGSHARTTLPLHYVPSPQRLPLTIACMPGFPLARGSVWAGGRDHTPSRVPQRWGTPSCREAAPLTPHAQPGTPAVGYHQLSRGSSTYTTRPAGYPSGGEPPAVERQLHLHHTPSRIPQRWGTTSCREAAPLTPHAHPVTQAVGHHQLPTGSSTDLEAARQEKRRIFQRIFR